MQGELLEFEVTGQEASPCKQTPPSQTHKPFMVQLSVSFYTAERGCEAMRSRELRTMVSAIRMSGMQPKELPEHFTDDVLACCEWPNEHHCCFSHRQQLPLLSHHWIAWEYSIEVLKNPHYLESSQSPMQPAHAAAALRSRPLKTIHFQEWQEQTLGTHLDSCWWATIKEHDWMAPLTDRRSNYNQAWRPSQHHQERPVLWPLEQQLWEHSGRHEGATWTETSRQPCPIPGSRSDRYVFFLHLCRQNPAIHVDWMRSLPVPPDLWPAAWHLEECLCVSAW